MRRDAAAMREHWSDQEKRQCLFLKGLGIVYPVCGFSIGDGWWPIVADTIGKMIDAGWDGDLRQVKTKFCTLRIYTGKVSKKVATLIEHAEALCNVACEECGRPHDLFTPRSGTALCKPCEDAYRKSLEPVSSDAKK